MEIATTASVERALEESLISKSFRIVRRGGLLSYDPPTGKVPDRF
jgi:hypothetical protein